MTEALTPRWQEADEAVHSLVAVLVAEAARTADRSARKRPRGRTRSKSTRRHIAEVVRAHKLAPGLRVDRNMVAALMLGHRDLISNPVLVVAVAQACGIITGRKLAPKRAARLRAASVRVGKLIARANAETIRVPAPRPAPVPPAPSVPSAPSAEVAPVLDVAPVPDAAAPVPGAASVPESAPVPHDTPVPHVVPVPEPVPVPGAAPVKVEARPSARRASRAAARVAARKRRHRRQRARRRWLLVVGALLVLVAAVLVGLAS
ncbi:hypothetical protein ACQEVZ_43455 [Dactylosporangium sp. CA-152071]|uniref:hypothetical protein n=1 Tax=Dactylosporangium sp. CA-152071 TaxID=3239933 RepID=UPI003D8E84AE